MGLPFIDVILSLVAALCGVFAAYLVGHALSADHAGWAWIGAGILALLAMAIGALTVRRSRRHARPPRH